MRHRFTKVLLGAALFMLLGGTATVAARSHSSSQPRVVQRRVRLPAHRACSAPTARSRSRASSTGLKYATKGTNKVNGKTINLTFVDDKTDAATARLRGEGPDRPGLQDHRWAPARRASRCRSRRSRPRTRCSTSRARRPPTRSPASTSTRSAPVARPYQDVHDAATVPEGLRQEGRRLRPGLGLRSRQLRRGQGRHRRQGPHRHRDLGAADRDRLHAVRPAGEEREPRPHLRRVGRHHGRRDVEGARPAERRSTAPTSSPVSPSARPGRALGDQATKIHFLSHYVYTAPKNKVNDWLVDADAQEEPGAGHLHAGRLRARRRCSSTRCRRATTTSTR